MNEPGETGQKQSGPDFEHALGTCLLSGVILVDAEAKTATLSPEARQILRFSSEQRSEVPLELIPPAISNIAREALLSGKPTSARQVSLSSGSSGTALANISAVPLKANSTNSGVILILHSLNSPGQFVQQILQLDRLANMGTLAAGLAHEIKNALVASRTFLDLLLEKNADEELVQIVRRETGRIDAIVSRMLRFAGTANALGPLHVHEVLDHALRLVQPQLAAKSIRLERSFNADPDKAKGDEYELQQAFVNLLLNSLEAMSENANLAVRTENYSEGNGGPLLRVVIRDTGSGILPEHMQHLFEPFFTTKPSGTGLGLATTRRIVQEHGGSISVDSRPGQGTTFAILLPLLIEHNGTQPGDFAIKVLGGKPS